MDPLGGLGSGVWATIQYCFFRICRGGSAEGLGLRGEGLGFKCLGLEAVVEVFRAA